MEFTYIQLQIMALRTCFLFGFCVAVLFCAGCVRESQNSFTNTIDNQQLSTLPSALQKEHVSLKELLNYYDDLNDEQQALALEHLLTEANLPGTEQSEAAYMLGRIYQESMDKNKARFANQVLKKEKCKEMLALFNKAQLRPALRNLSLWQISEVATICGEEKIVRQALNDILGIVHNNNDIAAAKYGLAQSYLRANQKDMAIDAFKKIRDQFPDTNYALGSAYYLGTLAYAQFEQEHKLKYSPENSLKAGEGQIDINKQNGLSILKMAVSYYLEYLQKSPAGHFAMDILAKLEIIDKIDGNLIGTEKLPIIANAYAFNGRYKKALIYWLRAGSDKYMFELAECSFRLGQMKQAQEKLFKGIEKYPTDKRYLSLAKAICEELNKQDALNIWEKLYKCRASDKDEIVWNIAIRTRMPQALHYYQQIVMDYPGSIYAAEAQWRIFWQRIRQSNGKSLIAVGNWCAMAAKKYNHSKMAPRFLFWAGKLSEEAFNKQQAAMFYQQDEKLYPTDYYGQRAKARYAYITNGNKDNYFELQSSGIMYGIKCKDEWSWPSPNRSLEKLQTAQNDTGQIDTVKELIYLKQYYEVLAQNFDLPLELIVWLKGKTKQPMQAINLASNWLHGNNTNDNRNKESSHLADDNLLLQYSYPLLYNKEITKSCSASSITDPLFMHALIREESRYETRAVSSVKALGLCQLMPSTATTIAKGLGINIIDSSQFFDPYLNIKLGSLYLSLVLKTFNGNALLAIASYNAGVNAVKGQLANQQPISQKGLTNALTGDPDYFVEDFPYKETRDYIRKVFNSYYRYREIYH